MIGLLEDYTALIIQAILAIWIGSRRSLTSQVVERLSSKDAWQFPFIGSGVLVGIFIVVKYVRKDLLDALVAIYFASIGAVCLAQVIRPIIKKFIPTVQRFSLFGDRLSFDFVDVVSFTIGISVGVVWAITKNWVASNILGFGFAVEAITIIVFRNVDEKKCQQQEEKSFNHNNKNKNHNNKQEIFFQETSFECMEFHFNQVKKIFAISLQGFQLWQMECSL